jgi:hypothetical protein
VSGFGRHSSIRSALLTAKLYVSHCAIFFIDLVDAVENILAIYRHARAKTVPWRNYGGMTFLGPAFSNLKNCRLRFCTLAKLSWRDLGRFSSVPAWGRLESGILQE